MAFNEVDTSPLRLIAELRDLWREQDQGNATTLKTMKNQKTTRKDDSSFEVFKR